mmetsp:Transcript_27232/g.68692  ORF Transcript_27232/g.68692 Transcript_27232/m.68692 type:complete len:907 (-) Transcript_27232:724-3444(-)|eukprot:CAMPEP_0178995298 /NCGR_PEP_ID=MMETSP0795-20121207/7758_1 /TAXON_ID=88552 /ORGANISM="Amoebophrya sp., Strain Ameob2" /LENGTH=906 /DNA_ID=CAMNT_0020687607 /DNA_START=421 /DNA_END=3141 /DNA_ORIENTATION=+
MAPHQQPDASSASATTGTTTTNATAPTRTAAGKRRRGSASSPKNSALAEQLDQEHVENVSVSRILRLARPERFWLVVGLFFLLLSLIPPLLLPLAFGALMDEIMVGADADTGAPKPTSEKREAVNVLALQLLMLLALGAFATAIRSFIFNAAGERVVARLRLQLFASIVTQELAMFDERKTGELMSRLTSDCTSLQDVSTSNLSMFLRGLIELILSAVMMMVTSWRLSVLAFCVVPFVVGALALYGWRLQKISTLATDALGESSNAAQEAIANVRTMRSFAGEGLELGRFRKALGDPDDLSACNTFEDMAGSSAGDRVVRRANAVIEMETTTGRGPQDAGVLLAGPPVIAAAHHTVPEQPTPIAERTITGNTSLSKESDIGTAVAVVSKKYTPATAAVAAAAGDDGFLDLDEADHGAEEGARLRAVKPNALGGCLLPDNDVGCCWCPPRKSRTVYRFGILKQLMNAGFIAVVTLLGYGVTDLVIWYGAHLVLDGRMTPGDLIAFLVYAVQVGGSISLLTHLIAILYQALGAARRTFQLIDREPLIPLEIPGRPIADGVAVAGGPGAKASFAFAPPSSKMNVGKMNEETIEMAEVVVGGGGAKTSLATIDESGGGAATASKARPLASTGEPPEKEIMVEFQEVSFVYPSRPDVKVLRRIDFQIPMNATVAFVGQSGGGKSTIMALLQRFYDVSAGRILLNNVDIRDLQHQELRANFAWVQQEPVLFGVSIAENIAYGWNAQQRGLSSAEKMNGGDEQEKFKLQEAVVAAAKAAYAHEFVTAFPEGYDTLVGERGVRLSGGQKQRIAIARALMVNPKVLLLDEATSALDSESEALVQKAIEQLMRGRTTLIVAHRLSTVRRADQIFVLDRHKIQARGTHEELMASSEKYRDLVRRQIEQHEQKDEEED